VRTQVATCFTNCCNSRLQASGCSTSWKALRAPRREVEGDAERMVPSRRGRYYTRRRELPYPQARCELLCLRCYPLSRHGRDRPHSDFRQ
jgi:hypothetical protein